MLTAKVFDVELGKTTLAEIRKLAQDASSPAFGAPASSRTTPVQHAVFGKFSSDEALKRVEGSVQELF